jgi:TatD DNase family protein
MSRTPDEAPWHRSAVDTHCHLTHIGKKGINVGQLLGTANDAGMERIIDVGIVPSDLSQRVSEFSFPGLTEFTSGLHPTEVSPDCWEKEIEILKEQFQSSKEKLVAVGECGLDFYWSDEHKDLQIEALRQQAEIAREYHVPLILHNRASEAQMLDFLAETKPLGVMHCFSQDEDYCRRCLELDMYISFGGNITYKKSDAIRAAAAIVPDSKLLVETDAPYLSPQPVRGSANHSGYLGYTMEALARIRNTTAGKITEITARNAREFFGL